MSGRASCAPGRGYRSGVRRGLLVGVGVLALATACGAAPGTDAVTRTADGWLAAARARDATALCRLLTPAAAESAVTGDETCAQAIGDLDLPADGPVGQVEVWSDRAQVKAGTETLFLTEVAGSWRVSAAGCMVRPGRPYDCEVSG
jgi:hypothetical protein